MLACNNPPNPNPFSYIIHMCRERRGQSRKQSADKMLIMTRMRTPMTAIMLMQRGEEAAAAAQFIASHLERVQPFLLENLARKSWEISQKRISNAIKQAAIRGGCYAPHRVTHLAPPPPPRAPLAIYGVEMCMEMPAHGKLGHRKLRYFL